MHTCLTEPRFIIISPDVIDLDLSTPNLTEIEQANTVVKLGGSWAPNNCVPWQHLAIIVPYRDRWEHLQLMLRRLHPMLRRQRSSYQIIVVEQVRRVTLPQIIKY